jgi:hypothetical protein
MRRRHRRAPLLLSVLVLVVALGAACSDDGGDDGTSPTTTSPTTEAGDGDGGGDEGTTTTEAPEAETTASEPMGTTEPGAVPGDDADVLTPEQAEAQLEALLAIYRQAVLDARAANVVDERTLRALSGALTGQLADGQLPGLRDGLATIDPAAPALVPEEVEVTSTTGTCAAGTAVIAGLDGLFAGGDPATQPYYYRLEPAAEGASAPGWRIALLVFSSNGLPIQEATCA